jgi:hypothetical protein
MGKETIKIHGKDYETVASRVARFRAVYGQWCIATELLHHDAERVVMKAVVADHEGTVMGVGHAEEYRKASSINKTSAMENAETSAIGRALAACGYGGTEYASANEIVGAGVDSLQEHLDGLKRCQSMDELHKFYEKVYTLFTDTESRRILVECKDECKSKLTKK